jgi:methyl-accepting chemotaxis protein
MKNMSIGKKVMTLLGGAGLFLLAVAAFAGWQIGSINSGFRNLTDHEIGARASFSRAIRAFADIRGDISDLLISTTDEGNRAAMGAIKSHRDEFTAALDNAKSVLPSAQDAIEKARTTGATLLDTDCDATIKAGLAATAAEEVTASQKLFRETCSPKFADVIKGIQAIQNDINQIAEVRKQEIGAEALRAQILTIGFILAGTLVLLLVGLLASKRTVVGPMRALETAMGSLAAGDLAVNVPEVDRADEIGQMAKAVLVFRDNAVRVRSLEEEEKRLAAERLRKAQSMVQVVGEVGEVVRRAADGDFSARLQIATDDPDMAKLVNGINEINRVVDEATGEFAEALDGLAQGDLTRTIQTPYRGRFGELKSALNETVGRLAQTVTTIQSTAREVTAAAQEINTGANDLSSRTEQQASSLEETAATTEELAASVKATAASSRHAVDLAEQNMQVARDGGDIVGKAVEAMSRIDTASQKISDITGVIDEIAFQTNLLALNAAVEAARAGDAGKGFAVVASEVRTLAQRSSEAAKEITALINASVAEVGKGVELVRSAGNALGEIVQASQRVTSTVSEISSASAEQANGIDEMSQAVANMDQMTQQNAALAEESAASASSLSEQIDRLNRLVAAFRVEAGSRSGGEPQRLQSRVAAAFESSSQAKTLARKVLARTTSPGAQSSGRTGTWDEF